MTFFTILSAVIVLTRSRTVLTYSPIDSAFDMLFKHAKNNGSVNTIDIYNKILYLMAALRAILAKTNHRSYVHSTV